MTAPPDWIADASRALARDVRGFGAALGASVLRPRRFARAWAEGTSPELNPVAFLATSAAVLGTAQAALGFQGSSSLAGQVASALLPYAHWALLGGLAHAALRALGSAQPFRTSLGVALYVGGGAGLLLNLLTYAASFGLVFATGAENVDAAFAGHRGLGLGLFVLVLGAQVAYLTLALAGAHRLALGRALAAVLAALVATAALYGAERPPSSVGAHVAILWIDQRPRVTIRF